MRTFGKKDFSDFQFVREAHLGKLYNVTLSDSEKLLTMLIIETEDLKMALDIMSESFRFNSLKNNALLSFHGCYLEEI